MFYLTYWHWIVTALFIPLLAYMVAQSFLVRRRNLILPMLLVSVAAVAIAYAVVFIALENVTKKGELLEIEPKRVLMNETMVFKGRVRNVGDYFSLTLEKKAQKEKPQVQEEDFVIAKKLDPGSIHPFAVSMPYPPHFRKTRYFYKLKCH